MAITYRHQLKIHPHRSDILPSPCHCPTLRFMVGLNEFTPQSGESSGHRGSRHRVWPVFPPHPLHSVDVDHRFAGGDEGVGDGLN